MDNYYLIEGAIWGFLELIGIGIAVALYVSERRARTEAEHFIYSPTYKPTLKTPKWAFIPLPLVAATLLVTIGVRDTWQGHLSAVAIFVSTLILWLCGLGAFASMLLLTLTSRPIDGHSPGTSPEEPSHSSFDRGGQDRVR